MPVSTYSGGRAAKVLLFILLRWPRTCIGVNVTMFEIQQMLAQVLRHFRVISISRYPVEPVAELRLSYTMG